VTNEQPNITGASVDDPKIANLTDPQQGIYTINGMALDMVKMAEAAQRLGVQKGDVMSVGAYRNGKGILTPDYDTARIERRVGEPEPKPQPLPPDIDIDWKPEAEQ
jgi:hypothetical protein